LFLIDHRRSLRKESALKTVDGPIFSERLSVVYPEMGRSDVPTKYAKFDIKRRPSLRKSCTTQKWD